MSSTAAHATFPAAANEVDLNAYNAAFHELGLPWQWDAGTWQALTANPLAKEPVQLYLETEQAHLLRAYEADFLVQAVQQIRQRFLGRMAANDASGHS